MERDVPHTKLARRLIALAFATTIVAPPMVATAQDPDDGSEAPDSEYKAYLAKAQDLYSQEDYVGAAQAYQAAYNLKPNPNLLYNIARIYEKAGKFEDAIAYYEKFAKQPDIKLDARKDAIERLKALREVVALDKPPEPDPKDEPKDTTPTEPEKIVEATPDPEPEPVGETNYTPAIITLGAGVLALGGGGAMGALAANAASEAEDATSLADFQTAAQNGSTYALAADGLFVLGGALTVTGVILLLTASPEKADSSQAVITPVVGPDGVGVSTYLRF